MDCPDFISRMEQIAKYINETLMKYFQISKKNLQKECFLI